jgi:hypothetical protein
MDGERRAYRRRAQQCRARASLDAFCMDTTGSALKQESATGRGLEFRSMDQPGANITIYSIISEKWPSSWPPEPVAAFIARTRQLE